MPGRGPDYLKGRTFVVRDGKVTCELGNGTVVELPVNGELDLEKWSEGLIRYVHYALLALESPTTPFIKMQGYDDGRVSFPIAEQWFGWGKHRDGEKVFALFGGYPL